MRLILLLEQTLLQKQKAQAIEEDLSALYSYVDKLEKKHEVWIACDAAFPETIIAIRRRLISLIAQDRIRVFNLPFKENAGPNKDGDHIKTNQLIYNYFLTQLHPDILLSVDCSSNTITAEPYHATYQRMKRKKRSLALNTDYRPTLAYFSPIFPAKSGISNYSSDLLSYLSHYYEITLILDKGEGENQHGGITFKTSSSDDFLKNNTKFDRILYHFGNSFYHSYMWPILKQYPGVVVLHDFFLSHLLSYEEFVNGKQNFWMEQLFKSHGYHALKEYFNKEITDETILKYPCNYEVIQHALGVIVHSNHSKNLAKQWYSINSLKAWETIPLLRKSVDKIDKNHARKALGFSENDLIICSFGLLNASKLNHRLLQAFLDSKLSKNQNCFLVFVGENNSGEYAAELNQNILNSSAKNRIKITGWVDNDTFKRYLQIADIGVQLRTISRGETSAAVLDCMNYAIPTIVNANGSMADLPQDSVYMLEDDFEQHTLINALEYFGNNKNLREDLGAKAKNFIHTHHDPQSCALHYKKTIETMYQDHFHYTELIDSIANIKSLTNQTSELETLSKSISQSTLPKVRQKQLLVDVSALSNTDLKTGIERVVRAQLLALIDIAPNTIRVEPVYLCEEGGIHYRYARKFASSMLGLPVQLSDKAVVVDNGDIFYGLDFFRDGIVQAAKTNIYTKWSSLGVSINFAVYDLLPIQHPAFFVEGSEYLHAQWLKSIISVSDTLICISQSVADELKKWMSIHFQIERYKKIEIISIPLGSDIAASSPSTELPRDAEQILVKIKERPTFLMVGTIEPRKGHLQTLSAFEILWEKGIDVNLVIVGKEGWKDLPDSQRRTIPEIVQKLRNHPKSNDSLFWLEGISDLFLEKLYQDSTVLIAASENEGFGLPLIEAAHYNLPLIVRDIPIFKEVASENAFYFSNTTDPSVLANAIIVWLETYFNNNHVPSSAMTHITWKECTRQVIESLLTKKSKQNPSDAMSHITRKECRQNVTDPLLVKKNKEESSTVKRKKTCNSIKYATKTQKGQNIYPLTTRAKEIYHDLMQMKNIEEQE